MWYFGNWVVSIIFSWKCVIKVNALGKDLPPLCALGLLGVFLCAVLSCAVSKLCNFFLLWIFWKFSSLVSRTLKIGWGGQTFSDFVPCTQALPLYSQETCLSLICIILTLRDIWILVFLNASVICSISYFFISSLTIFALLNLDIMAGTSVAIKNHKVMFIVEIRIEAATFIEAQWKWTYWQEVCQN